MVGIKSRGQVTIVDDGASRLIFPSVVAYRNNGGKSSSKQLQYILSLVDIVVGYDALEYLRNDPEHTIYNSKRFIGRRLHLV